MKIKYAIILVTITLLGCNFEKRENDLREKTALFELELDQCKFSAEQILLGMKESFELEKYDTCKYLYAEMEKRYYTSKYFNAALEIYQNILEIEEKIQEKQRIEEEKLKLASEKEREELRRRYLTVHAQAYPDGIISCNLYFRDPKGNTYDFEGGKIDYKVYDIGGSEIRILNRAEINTQYEAVYVDIPIGRNRIRQARTIEFIYTNTNGKVYKSKVVEIDR